MSLLPTIATSNFDILIGVVAAIGWVVVQIMSKAAKNKPPSASTPGGVKPEPPEDAGPVSDAAEEMRRFFQRLEEAHTPDRAPKKTPPATLTTSPERGQRTTAGSRAITSSGQAVTSSSQRTASRRSSEQQVPAALVATDNPLQPAPGVCLKPAVVMNDAMLTYGAFADAHAHGGRLEFVRRLRCTKALRRAVMRMEVITPPLGLRRTPFPIG